MAGTGVRRAVRGLANVPSEALARELDRRRSVASQLESKRSALLAEVADLEQEIRQHGGSLNGVVVIGRRGGPGTRRGDNTSTLPQALAAAEIAWPCWYWWLFVKRYLRLTHAPGVALSMLAIAGLFGLVVCMLAALYSVGEFG